ncbi:MAG: hypothetical protein JKZ03_07510 [Flavobacteriaceae bacterium]|nr:hypothetical protein [Flavobacteriaceae bacterium]
MKKVFYLKTCDTCKRIIKTLLLPSEFVFQEIKEEAISSKQLEELRELSGSYEALFSRRAKLYKAMGLKDAVLSEADYKDYILQHYTFIKRPIVVVEEQIFIGNSKNTVEAASKAIHE